MGVEAKGGRGATGADPRPAWQEALIDQLFRTLSADGYQPPLLPGAALRLLDLARDPNLTTSHIIGLLESEPLLVARVLRAAQSPRIRTIEDAVLQLGTRATAALFTEAAVQGGVFSNQKFQAPMYALRRHSTATARIARQLAERIGQPGDQVYLCGLLHDIGVAACLLVAPELEAPDGRPFGFAELEQPIFDVHEQAGEILTSLWNMPEGLREVLAHHHSVAQRAPVSPVAALVGLSSWIASQAGAGVIEGGDRDEQALSAALQLGWAEQLPELVSFGEGLVSELASVDP
ncbi:MAG TPA: HDOD domain-containing protein [Polyangiaceae bacterium]|jgi:putative nucleotidyltransferase with HDIG domain|nr:HDOD domain-containing protein [Polyangiaceae bacterium]